MIETPLKILIDVVKTPIQFLCRRIKTWSSIVYSVKTPIGILSDIVVLTREIHQILTKTIHILSGSVEILSKIVEVVDEFVEAPIQGVGIQPNFNILL